MFLIAYVIFITMSCLNILKRIQDLEDLINTLSTTNDTKEKAKTEKQRALDEIVDLLTEQWKDDKMEKPHMFQASSLRVYLTAKRSLPFDAVHRNRLKDVYTSLLSDNYNWDHERVKATRAGLL